MTQIVTNCGIEASNFFEIDGGTFAYFDILQVSFLAADMARSPDYWFKITKWVLDCSGGLGWEAAAILLQGRNLSCGEH